ncbi:MAG: DUF3893 domain-containing protein, partial [Pseudonocardiaceae bacterium]|nr:DUF3893 domain-containing protein [Pseudonocardiaceae bacterium]
MTTNDGGLHTLTYRVDATALGTLSLYALTPEFRVAWDHFESLVRRRSDRPYVRPRYSDLATALTAVTGQPVRLFPSHELSPVQKSTGVDSLLVTTQPIAPWLLATAVRTFERLVLNNDRVDTLSEHLATASPIAAPLSDFIGYHDGHVDAPGWIYNVAQWNLAARIAQQPLLIDGHLPIRLRIDSQANLVAWDDPIQRPWKDELRYAMVYLDTSIVTLPGAAHLYLRVDGHVARVPYSWWNVKNAWVAPRDERQPLLRLPVHGPWPARGRTQPTYAGVVTDIVHACQLDPLPTLPDEPRQHLGAVRLIGKPSGHPIGVGTGARFLFQAQRQIRQRLGLSEPAFRRTKISTGKSTSGHIQRDKLDDAIAASGAQRLRIACLYGQQGTRRRMADALSVYASAEENPLLGATDGEQVDLTERLSVVFHHDPIIVGHGEHVRDLDDLAYLKTEEGCGVAAWVETDWDGTAVEHDAKPILRADLGKRGIVAQFLSTNYKPRKPSRRKDGTTPPTEDHPANAAVRDLLRQVGVIDHRLANATANTRISPLTRAATLVGVHIRQHTPRKNGGPRRLVIQIVALHATPDPHAPWRVEMYDDTEGWLPYREANARYYASDIGQPHLDRTRTNAPHVREYVDQALAALPRTVPLVVFVDAEACRSFWPGLKHSRFGNDTVPGSSIENPDLAVVRVSSGTETLRPTHVDRGGNNDPYKPNLPGQRLYEHEENGVLTWILSQPSRTHRAGAEGRAGTDNTRWTLPDKRERWMENPWHALNTIEIAIPRPGTWQPDPLAALTARLCHQAAAWDDRTLLPSPLHLAKSSDQDHPGYPPTEDDG